jgi:transcriptional regulator with XRE-family HTH domain
MVISERLRELREEKKLSQGDVEARTGLLRSYLSRVENGHTVPSLETLEKLAAALEIPLYQLLYDGNEPPRPPDLSNWKPGAGDGWSNKGKDAVFLHKLRRLLGRTSEQNRQLILYLAQRLASRQKRDARRAKAEQQQKQVHAMHA